MGVFNFVEIQSVYCLYLWNSLEFFSLFSTAIWSYLAHSWSGLNYICKAKYKTHGNG